MSFKTWLPGLGGWVEGGGAAWSSVAFMSMRPTSCAGGAQLHDRHSGSPRGSLTPQGSRTLNPSAWGSSGASSPQGAPPTGPARPHGGIGARQGSQGFTEAELGPDAAPTKKRGQSHWVSQIGAAPPGRLRKPSDLVAAEVGAAAAGHCRSGCCSSARCCTAEPCRIAGVCDRADAG